MLTKIAGGEIIDPANGRLGTGDLWIEGDRIVEAPQGGAADRIVEAAGCIVMAGAIDIHSHIGGGFQRAWAQIGSAAGRARVSSPG